jgi:hypothetical protein
MPGFWLADSVAYVYDPSGKEYFIIKWGHWPDEEGADRDDTRITLVEAQDI